MNTLFRWIITGSLALVTLAFSLLNAHSVPVSYSPFQDQLSVSLAFICLAFLIAGFVCGGVIVWLNGAGVRRERRRQKKIIQKLEMAQAQRESEETPVAPYSPHYQISSPKTLQ